MDLTFIFGPNTTGDNQECVLVTLLNDNILEGNETFDILITSTAEDEDLLNITDPVITVTIEEDNTDCEPLFRQECRLQIFWFGVGEGCSC